MILGLLENYAHQRHDLHYEILCIGGRCCCS